MKKINKINYYTILVINVILLICIYSFDISNRDLYVLYKFI